MRLHLAALATVALLSGCVTQGTFDAKQAELDALKADSAKRDQDQQAKISQLQGELDQNKKDLAAAQAAGTQLGDQLKALGAEKGTLSQNLAEAQKQMEQLRKKEAAERERAALYHKLVEKLKSMIDAGKLAVQVRNGKMLVKLQNDILFAAGSAAVKAQGKEVLQQLAQVLASVPDRNFQVTGHTDDTPMHSAQFPSNWELSTERAINVVNILTSAGVDPKHLSAAGYAENDPVSPNDSSENKQKNRRIEIVVQPNIDELPQMDENAPSAAK